MSVQIRRRREAASFLSTYVGAQGELIVDTTNNRVQVHDGSTAGGFPAARLDEVSLATKFTSVSDANYAILPTDGVVALIAALTAPRTLTLPTASSVKPGKSLRITDQAGGVSATNTLTVAAAGSDKINGAASSVFAAPFSDFPIVSDGVSKWTYDVQGIARGGTGATNAADARAALGAQASGALYGNSTVLTAASGTWTVPAGVTQLQVSLQAAGGGGGGVAAAVAAAAGGSSGEFVVALLTVTPGQSIAYTNDTAGGAGGAAGANAGSAGGGSTFGALTASGGPGGAGSASGNAAATTAGVLNLLRHAGAPTATVEIRLSLNNNGGGGAAGVGGIGGPAPAWGLAGSQGTNAAGGAASGYGSGGGGASSTSTSSGPFAGGRGAAGAISVRW